MKVGDRVEVVELISDDYKTDIKLGATCDIEKVGDRVCAIDNPLDLFLVRFDEPYNGPNGRAYYRFMFRKQLKKIGAAQ